MDEQAASPSENAKAWLRSPAEGLLGVGRAFQRPCGVSVTPDSSEPSDFLTALDGRATAHRPG